VEIILFLEWKGPSTRDEIQTMLLPSRLSMDELIRCLTYLTDEGLIKLEDGCRFGLTAKGRGHEVKRGPEKSP
jgi:predicted methyltransferase